MAIARVHIMLMLLSYSSCTSHFIAYSTYVSFHNAVYELIQIDTGPHYPCPRVFFNCGLNKWFVIVMLPLYVHFSRARKEQYLHSLIFVKFICIFISYENVHLWRLFEFKVVWFQFRSLWFGQNLLLAIRPWFGHCSIFSCLILKR